MIPKIIHYCWLSNDPMPAELKRCIKSWKRKLPDYKIKKWDTHNFDIYSIPFVAEACKMRKWAFACDYIRVYALYTEGGIYMDSDVFVRNSLDFCLANRAFSAVECYPESVEKIYAEGQVDAEGNKRKDIQYIKDCCYEVENLINEGKDYYKEDANFHVAIAKASGNSIIHKITQVIHSSIKKNIFMTDNTLCKDTIVFHKRIIDCIENGDISGAKYAMINHLDAQRRFLIDNYKYKLTRKQL